MRIAGNILLFFVLSAFCLHAQKEAAVWYFGDHAGLDFNSGEPVLWINSAMRAEAGCAAISNQSGQLQFYTNGKEVWNREHIRMPNGYGLNGSQLLNQNSIVVPLPGSDTVYYLFTINAYYDSVGMNYSVINMNRDGGNGDVVLRNQLMHKGFVEKIAATGHCNGKDIWVLAHDRTNLFYSYLLTENGIFKDTIVSKAGSYVKADIGYMKISPASNQLAFPSNNDSLLVEILRFDNKTGEVFEPVKIFARDETTYAYGLEFSPDGNLFYMSTGGKKYRLWQFDLTNRTDEAVNASATLLAEGNHFAMQLAPDGKIYIAKQNRDYLSAINNPDKRGPDCDYQEDAVSLQGRYSLMGLPNFISSFFYQPGFSYRGSCLGDTTYLLYNQYLNSDSVTWEFGDNTPPVTLINEPKPYHLYNKTGSYRVKLFIYSCGKTDTAVRDLEIFPYPEINLGSDTGICGTCSLTLDGGADMDFWLWQDGSNSRYFEVVQPGQYSVLVNKNGCYSGDTIMISNYTVRVTMPNAFSPNGDGKNDEFKAVFNELPEYYQLTIFDRNGRFLFQTNDITSGWNGQYQGSDCMIGTYIFRIRYRFYENNVLYQRGETGSVVLLR